MSCLTSFYDLLKPSGPNVNCHLSHQLWCWGVGGKTCP